MGFEVEKVLVLHYLLVSLARIEPTLYLQMQVFPEGVTEPCDEHIQVIVILFWKTIATSMLVFHQYAFLQW